MKLLNSAVVITSLLIGTSAQATPTEEVLLGIDIQPSTLELHVASGGCTDADSFEINVDKGVTGKPPYLVTVVRVKPDDCKMLVIEGEKISFDRKKLGLDGLIEFSISNKIGNTSNHR